MDNVNITSSKLVDTEIGAPVNGLISEGWEWTKAHPGTLAMAVVGAAALTAGFGKFSEGLTNLLEGPSVAPLDAPWMAAVGGTTAKGLESHEFEAIGGTSGPSPSIEALLTRQKRGLESQEFEAIGGTSGPSPSIEALLTRQKRGLESQEFEAIGGTSGPSPSIEALLTGQKRGLEASELATRNLGPRTSSDTLASYDANTKATLPEISWSNPDLLSQ